MTMRACLGLLVFVGIAACGGGDEAPAVCGDGDVGGTEQCDDGNSQNDDGCSVLCKTEVSTCGNGDVDVATETCDDGNSVDGDGCSRRCQTECGNGQLDGTEACDDGNLVDGDGCAKFCVVEASYTCTGEPSDCIAPTGTCADPFVLDLQPGGGGLTASVTGDTAASTDQVAAGPCDGSTAGGGNDHLWKFSIPDTRDVSISIAAGTTFDSTLRLLAIACDGASEVAESGLTDGCSDDGFGTSPETLTFTALPAGTYYAVVDGSDSSESGGYYLAVTATTSQCGDGTLDLVENCDDGNLVMSDGCSPTCDVEAGYACTGQPSVCGSACGSGALDPGEECDDDNTASGDRCSATCTLEADVLEVEPNDAAAQVVTAGNHILRGALPANDVDLYQFTLTTPAVVTIETYDSMDNLTDYTGRGSITNLDCTADLDTLIRLFSAAGNPVTNTSPLYSDDQDGDASCSYLGPNDVAVPTQGRLAAGTYTLRVSNYYSSDVASRYLVDLQIATIVPVAPVGGDLVLNEVMADDATTDSNCDGDIVGTTDEYIELVNVSSKVLDLTGVTIADAISVRHTFAMGTPLLEPGKAIVVWAGGAPACPGVTSWVVASTGQLALNNAGETITIKNAAMATLFQHVFPAAVPNVSANRSPDIVGTTYALHYNVNGSMGGSSPGKKVNQSAF